MSTPHMSRRDFLGRLPVVLISSYVLIENAGGQNTEYIIAETSCGRIRGI